MESKKIYWKGIGQLTNRTEFVKNGQDEFGPDPGPEEDLGHSRRDFLKMMGFGVAAASLAACEAPVRNAIPFVHGPDDYLASVPNYYASTYINGGDYCSIVVKTREGRPIKVDGNALSSVTRGGTNAQVEASVLSLYDNDRLRGPKSKGSRITWEELDAQVTAKLNEISRTGGQIRIVSNSILSPTTKLAIERFASKYPTTQHIQYDAVSEYGIRKANQESFGSAFTPSYDFSKASTIVSIGADFLGSWGATIEHTKQYAQTREVSETKKEMSRHYQFEPLLTMTGANADYRTPIKPSEEGAVVVALYNLIARKAGRPTVSGGADEKPHLSRAADELWQNRGKALVVAGSNDSAVQVLVNGINDMLGSYGTTILPNLPVNYRQGNDEAMNAFVNDVVQNRIAAVIFYNCNPVYDHPRGAELGEAIKAASLSIATGYKEEETGALCQYLAPDHHYLESWNDAEPRRNHFSLSQPVITQLFKTRQVQESLLVWAGEEQSNYFEFLKENWRTRFHRGAAQDFQAFWDKCLYDGVFEQPVTESATTAFSGDVSAAASAIASNYKSSDVELVVYASSTIGDGSQANNPLLQELADPITKVVWDNYVTVSVKDAAKISFDESHTKMASITVNGTTVKLPVMVQPGQLPGTLGIALGYGRTKAGRVADNIGANVFPFVSLVNGSLSYTATDVQFEIHYKEDYQLAQTQTQNTYMGRKSVIQETTLSEFNDGTFAKEKFQPMINTWTSPDHKKDPERLTLWKDHEYKGHHWGMAIDLNTCIGCGACIVACNVENNVALVGREEVINRREMLWLRVDRYYSSDSPADDWTGAEIAAENPEVVFQPMLCQHCNNAPCETVCPVAATTHSTEGLNQMAYNRCIGTRYCANNCPYKVRRFNWFKYHDNKQFANVNTSMNTDLGKMVLNPDVTVRSRGVMEKCSFCVQRIQAGKLAARKEKRTLRDGEVVTACAAACSTGAILFGDMNDPESRIAEHLKVRPIDPERPHINDKDADNIRAYSVLEEIGTRPNIFYLAKVRNRDAANA